jgi:hypothetical protein
MAKRKSSNLPGLEFRPLGRPARRQSLYWLCYSGSLAFSQYNSEIVGKKETLRNVSNAGIYYSSDKVGTFSKIPPSTSMHFANRVRTCRFARLHSVQCTVQWNSSISETVQNRTHVHIHIFCLEWPILWPLWIFTFPPGTRCIRFRWPAVNQSGL